MSNYVTKTTQNKTYIDDTKTYLNENARIDNTRTYLEEDTNGKDIILLPCIKCGECTRHASQSFTVYSKEACDMLNKAQEYFHKTTCLKCGYTSIRTDNYEFQFN